MSSRRRKAPPGLCQPAPSRTRTAWAPGATARPISTRRTPFRQGRGPRPRRPPRPSSRRAKAGATGTPSRGRRSRRRARSLTPLVGGMAAWAPEPSSASASATMRWAWASTVLICRPAALTGRRALGARGALQAAAAERDPRRSEQTPSGRHGRVLRLASRHARRTSAPVKPGRRTSSQAAVAVAVSGSGAWFPRGLAGLLLRGAEPGVLTRAQAILVPGRGAPEPCERGDLLAGRPEAAHGIGKARVGGVAHEG